MIDVTRKTLWLVISLSVLLLFCVAILSFVNMLTHERILDNHEIATRKIIEAIIPGPYSNDIFSDSITVTEPGYLGSRQSVLVYRARNQDGITGVVFYPVITNGYNSQIELAIGISRDGKITGVRVISEDETDGLGSQIDQNESDWILSFNGISYQTVPAEQWKVSSEDGYFDQISGATITSRSVINAIRNTLDYHNMAKQRLYE